MSTDRKVATAISEKHHLETRRSNNEITAEHSGEERQCPRRQVVRGPPPQDDRVDRMIAAAADDAPGGNCIKIGLPGKSIL